VISWWPLATVKYGAQHSVRQSQVQGKEKQHFKFYIASYNVLNIDRVISKVEVREIERQAPSINGSLELCYWAKSSGHNRLSRLSTEGLKRF